MTRKCHVRFGGGRTEKARRRDLAGRLPDLQAAIAALLGEGIRPAGQWSHEFVQAQFVGQLINRRKRYDPDLRRVLADNQALRDKADYRTDLVTQPQASRAFIEAIRQGGGAIS